MTGRLRIITPNDADAATLTAVPSMAATLPQTNLQRPERALVARTTSTADQQIRGTWSTGRVISAVALNRHNLSSVSTWRFRLYADAVWADLIYDSGEVVAVPPKSLGDMEWGVDPLGVSLFTGWSHAFSQMWLEPIVARSFILTLLDGTNADGYMQASRLFVGRYLEPSINMDWGYGLRWHEDTTQERTDGGTLRSDGNDPYRRLTLRLSWLAPADRPKFAEWARRDGLRNDFWVSAFPEDATSLERDHAMAAKLTQTPEIAGRFYGTFGVDQYVMEEA